MPMEPVNTALMDGKCLTVESSAYMNKPWKETQPFQISPILHFSQNLHLNIKLNVTISRSKSMINMANGVVRDVNFTPRVMVNLLARKTCVQLIKFQAWTDSVRDVDKVTLSPLTVNLALSQHQKLLLQFNQLSKAQQIIKQHVSKGKFYKKMAHVKPVRNMKDPNFQRLAATVNYNAS